MTILLTGAWGIVGRATLLELARAGHRVRAFDQAKGRTRTVCRRTLRKLTAPERALVSLHWGSLTNVADLRPLCAGLDAAIHLGAIIPPLADRLPEQTELVNVDGTGLLIRELERGSPACRLVFSSSISIWGDRRKRPVIAFGEAPSPEDHDRYAWSKLKAEALVRASSLPWLILRLSYVVSPDKLAMDPLLFEMPLDTSIEICHVDDVALALRNAAESGERGACYPIAGGESCRTDFRTYLGRMFELFGIARRGGLPAEAWSTAPFHCAWMETAQSQARLRFQRRTLDDYYREVGRLTRARRWLMRLFKSLVWNWLLSRSPHWRRARALAAGAPA